MIISNDNRALKFFIGVILALLGLFLAAGCSSQSVNPTQVAERLPIIRMGDVYPDGVTPEEFWSRKQDFFKQYDARLAAGEVSEEEAATMGHLFELELLRRAGETKIREYNKHARERNRANGYQ